jgi:Concanavalin A-like lectin/glucanases superfamily/SPRY domain
MDYSGKIIKKTPVTPSQTSASGVWQLDEAMQATKTNTWPVANVPNPISRSLRIRSSATAYLNRTFGTPTNQKIWTYSFWFKRGTLSTDQGTFIGNNSSTDQWYFRISSNNTLYIGDYYNDVMTTTPVYRDPSSWYHIVLAVDTTQSTATDRIKLYVNSVQQSYTQGARFPTQNFNIPLNQASLPVVIGNGSSFTGMDGYITEVNFIDGQQLTPSSFGGTNAVTGVWEPRQYTGTYGTNGFYLNFKDNTSTTTLGYDYSGNSNNWTTNNISLTAGSTYDSMLDVPTQWIGYNTGDVASVTRGNYCTLNPNLRQTGTSSAPTNGNLKATVNNTSGYGNNVGSTMAASSGKFYWEITKGGTYGNTGIVNTNGAEFTSVMCTTSSTPSDPNAYSWGWALNINTGYKLNAGTSTAYAGALTSGDIVMCAVDIDAGKIWWGKNGTWFASGDPAAGTNAAFTNVTGNIMPFANPTDAGSNSQEFNFGQRPFSYTPPSGFLPLCTTNLSAPTILQGDDYFNIVTWTGTNTTGNRSVTGVGFQPDFVWAKSRSAAYDNCLYDALRGAGSTKELISNNAAAEGGGNQDQYGYLSSFDSDGFSSTVGSLGQNLYFNDTAYPNYVAWNWKANGGTGVTNTDGSITSTVSANTTSGFSIVTYTGNGTGGATVGHGLGVALSMLIVKSRTQGTYGNWNVWYTSLSGSQYLTMNDTSGASTNNNRWNGTIPTSTVFSLGADTFGNTNKSGDTYVAYCFSAVAGYSAFGSYTGNGSTDGTFVYTGFRPRWIMIKRTDTSGSDWVIYDSARSTYNLTNLGLAASLSDAESAYAGLDFVSNGFKLRATQLGVNTSGGTYMYMVFAENPFKNALAR